MSGEGGGFVRDAFHHATISAQRVDVEVEKVLKAGAVITGSQPLTGNSHTDTGRDTLAERSRGGLAARSPAVFRMSWTAAIQLAESFDGVQGYRHFAKSFIVLADGSDFSQMQQGIKQHRRMSDRQNEAIAVRPNGILWIKSQELL